MVLHLNKIESHSTKAALCQVCFKSAQWFWRRRFFNFVNVFSLFCNYLPLKKGGTLHLNKVESPSPKDALYKFRETGSVVLEIKIFLKFSMYFRYFVIISPWKRVGPFIRTNFYSLHPRMIYAKFGW